MRGGMNDATYDACAWGSHLPALLACLADTVGPVLEIGVGHFSTPALHAYCVSAGRALLSVEKDEKWMQAFKGNFKCSLHQFTDLADGISINGPWSVVLIDDSPGGENRANHFQYFIDRSVYVVVHDYHLENQDHIDPLLSDCHFHITKTYQPPTLIASKVREIPKSILCL